MVKKPYNKVSNEKEGEYNMNKCGCGNNNVSSAAFILVLFILLIIIVGALI